MFVFIFVLDDMGTVGDILLETVDVAFILALAIGSSWVAIIVVAIVVDTVVMLYSTYKLL